jgi:hypothetical protein
MRFFDRQVASESWSWLCEELRSFLADGGFDFSTEHHSDHRQSALHCYVGRIYRENHRQLLPHGGDVQCSGVTVPAFPQLVDLFSVLFLGVRNGGLDAAERFILSQLVRYRNI